MVAPHRVDRAGMHGKFVGLVELPVPNQQESRPQVDAAAVERDRFPDSDPGHHQQPDHTVANVVIKAAISTSAHR